MTSPGPERELLTRFEVQKFLGKGSYGSVYRVRRLSDNKVYALKETNVRNLNQQERQDAVNEIRLLASIKNTSITAYNEAFIDGNRLCIVMEYAPFGDLSRALRKRQTQRKLLPEDLIWSYFIQVARGLQALHSQHILHRDVKTANIMRMSGEVVKLGDLGVAKLMKGALTNTQIGTPHYMPPEVWRNRPYSFNSDVWALGCVLFEMATFTVPFEARSMEELRFKVMKGKFSNLPQVYSTDLQKMVKWLLTPEPTQRPDVSEVLSSPAVIKRIHLAPEPSPPSTPSTSQSSILDTIKVPKNIRMLRKRLPAPNYPLDSVNETAQSWPRKNDQHLPPITALSSVSDPAAGSPKHSEGPSDGSPDQAAKLAEVNVRSADVHPGALKPVEWRGKIQPHPGGAENVPPPSGPAQFQQQQMQRNVAKSAPHHPSEFNKPAVKLPAIVSAAKPPSHLPTHMQRHAALVQHHQNGGALHGIAEEPASRMGQPASKLHGNKRGAGAHQHAPGTHLHQFQNQGVAGPPGAYPGHKRPLHANARYHY